jgi:hypothetical protein
MDNKKTECFYIPGPLGGRKVFAVNLEGKKIQVCYGIDKIYRHGGAGFFVPPAEEPHNTDPKGGKIKVDPDKPGIKGNTPVQIVFYPRQGNPAGEQGGFILKKKEFSYDYGGTAQSPG